MTKQKQCSKCIEQLCGGSSPFTRNIKIKGDDEEIEITCFAGKKDELKIEVESKTKI